MKKKSCTCIAIMLVMLMLTDYLGQANARRAANIYQAQVIEETATTLEDLEISQSPAQHARHLVHNNIWATVSTLSLQFSGVPYGNTLSYSDGIGYSKEESTGEIFFYITSMDNTGKDLRANSTASVSIMMAQEGKDACTMDVEDPLCWKVTLVGKVVPVSAYQRPYAEKVLFSKHPQMMHWPKKHDFLPYVLEMEHIILLDYYGGAKHVSVDEYYHVKL